MNFKTVKSTREGLIGSPTASGLRIRASSVFVALPASEALFEIVAVRFNGIIRLAPVLDVGPWNVDDNDYVFGDARPQAESGMSISGMGTNGAGIDLSDGLIKKFGYHNPADWNNYNVEWSFINEKDLRLEA